MGYVFKKVLASSTLTGPSSSLQIIKFIFYIYYTSFSLPQLEKISILFQSLFLIFIPSPFPKTFTPASNDRKETFVPLSKSTIFEIIQNPIN